MVQIKVHIKSDNDFLDERVSVVINLPVVPRAGETLYLTEELRLELETKARMDLRLAAKYAPKWFYGASSQCREPKPENLKDLSFEDALFVSSVAYFADREIVQLEIDDERPK